MTPGDTFLPVSSQSPIPAHLYFVCTLPDSNDSVVILNMTSVKVICDDICKLAVGDHPSVIKPSYIEYGEGTLSRVDDIRQALKLGLFVSKQPAAPALIDRIRKGALVSDFTPIKVQRAIQACPWQP